MEDLKKKMMQLNLDQDDSTDKNIANNENLVVKSDKF